MRDSGGHVGATDHWPHWDGRTVSAEIRERVAGREERQWWKNGELKELCPWPMAQTWGPADDKIIGCRRLGNPLYKVLTVPSPNHQ